MSHLCSKHGVSPLRYRSVSPISQPQSDQKPSQASSALRQTTSAFYHTPAPADVQQQQLRRTQTTPLLNNSQVKSGFLAEDGTTPLRAQEVDQARLRQEIEAREHELKLLAQMDYLLGLIKNLEADRPATTDVEDTQKVEELNRLTSSFHSVHEEQQKLSRSLQKSTTSEQKAQQSQTLNQSQPPVEPFQPNPMFASNHNADGSLISSTMEQHFQSQEREIPPINSSTIQQQPIAEEEPIKVLPEEIIASQKLQQSQRISPQSSQHNSVVADLVHSQKQEQQPVVNNSKPPSLQASQKVEPAQQEQVEPEQQEEEQGQAEVEENPLVSSLRQEQPAPDVPVVVVVAAAEGEQENNQLNKLDEDSERIATALLSSSVHTQQKPDVEQISLVKEEKNEEIVALDGNVSAQLSLPESSVHNDLALLQSVQSSQSDSQRQPPTLTIEPFENQLIHSSNNGVVDEVFIQIPQRVVEQVNHGLHVVASIIQHHTENVEETNTEQTVLVVQPEIEVEEEQTVVPVLETSEQKEESPKESEPVVQDEANTSDKQAADDVKIDQQIVASTEQVNIVEEVSVVEASAKEQEEEGGAEEQQVPEEQKVDQVQVVEELENALPTEQVEPMSIVKEVESTNEEPQQTEEIAKVEPESVIEEQKEDAPVQAEEATPQVETEQEQIQPETEVAEIEVVAEQESSSPPAEVVEKLVAENEQPVEVVEAIEESAVQPVEAPVADEVEVESGAQGIDQPESDSLVVSAVQQQERAEKQVEAGEDLQVEGIESQPAAVKQEEVVEEAVPVKQEEEEVVVEQINTQSAEKIIELEQTNTDLLLRIKQLEELVAANEDNARESANRISSLETDLVEATVQLQETRESSGSEITKLRECLIAEQKLSNTERNKLLEQLLTAQDQVAVLEIDLGRETDEKTALTKQVDELLQKIREDSDAEVKLKVTLNDLSSELAAAVQREASVAQENQGMISELSLEKEKSESLVGQLEGLDKEMQYLKQQVVELELKNDEVQVENQAVKQDNAVLTQESSALKQENAALNQDKDDALAHIRAVEEERELLKNQTHQLLETIAELEDKLAAAAQPTTASGQLKQSQNQLQQSIQQLKEELEIGTSQSRQQQQQLEHSTHLNKDNKSRNHSLHASQRLKDSVSSNQNGINQAQGVVNTDGEDGQLLQEIEDDCADCEMCMLEEMINQNEHLKEQLLMKEKEIIELKTNPGYYARVTGFNPASLSRMTPIIPRGQSTSQAFLETNNSILNNRVPQFESPLKTFKSPNQQQQSSSSSYSQYPLSMNKPFQTTVPAMGTATMNSNGYSPSQKFTSPKPPMGYSNLQSEIEHLQRIFDSKCKEVESWKQTYNQLNI